MLKMPISGAFPLLYMYFCKRPLQGHFQCPIYIAVNAPFRDITIFSSAFADLFFRVIFYAFCIFI
jgi:hypothetical protein